jgi:hypothetical protein
MVSSGSTAATGVLPVDYRAGRTPFRTVRTTWHRSGESRMAIRGGLPWSDMFPAGIAGYRKSYIAAEPTR